MSPRQASSAGFLWVRAWQERHPATRVIEGMNPAPTPQLDGADQHLLQHEVVSQPRDITYAEQLPRECFICGEKPPPCYSEPPRRALSPSKCKCFCACSSIFASAWDTGDPEWSRRDKALLRDAGRDATPCWEPTTTDALMYRAWPSE